MIVCFIYESVEWKRNLEQNIIGFLSLPWLASEKLGYDLEFHKDNGYKTCSLNLIQNADKIQMIKLKKACIQLLCIMPKTACSQWRTHIISKW